MSESEKLRIWYDPQTQRSLLVCQFKLKINCFYIRYCSVVFLCCEQASWITTFKRVTFIKALKKHLDHVLGVKSLCFLTPSLEICVQSFTFIILKLEFRLTAMFWMKCIFLFITKSFIFSEKFQSCQFMQKHLKRILVTCWAKRGGLLFFLSWNHKQRADNNRL